MPGDLWVDRPVDGAATHALVVGVSRYRHLEGGEAPSAEGEDFALGQLSCAAVSAHRFAVWLRDVYRPPGGSLGSLHVLLAPSDDEVAAGVAPSGALPTRSAVEDAVFAWKQRCDARTDNTAVLYLAGHGVQLSKDSGVVLLHDFAVPARNLFHGGIDTGSILHGMARPNTAQTQLYFFDACRQRPKQARVYNDFKGALGFDETAGQGARTQPGFFSTAADTLSYGRAGHGTVFVDALLQCLDGVAVEGPDATYDGFGVRLSSLWQELPVRARAIADELGVVQEASLGGRPGVDVVLHTVSPQASLTVHVDPVAARPVTTASLIGDDDLVVQPPAPCDTDVTWQVEAGLYRVSVQVPAGGAWRARSKSVSVQPGRPSIVSADVTVTP